ncbi:MAG: bifunctional folylpolyglutamate synthase/dihydrofolate synthase [Bacteroidales bacterium]|nr:bifunctional folylpolyglutamate synthase/dihydrofolate synthase [Bacteroidales bacterium]
MTYQEKIEQLFSKIPSYQKVGKRAYKPGIESMTAFDAALGEPHKKFRSIHIAGTNGKGSVSSMLASILACAGYKVGLYTSPHLLDFRERMKIVSKEGWELISKEEVSDFLDKWDSFIYSENPSFFEITTAMAFDFFAKRKVDFAVIECGLGGRLDSTNVITPIMSVITNIGLEHCEHLGFTLEEIAGEKAGIIKGGVPVVIGESVLQTKPVFEAKADSCGSRISFAEDFMLPESFRDISPVGLGGNYQKVNIRTVCCAMDCLKSEIHHTEKDVAEGITNAAKITGLRGRWEKVASLPDMICDIGHNAHGLKYVFSQLAAEADKYRHIYIVFGVVGDKDIDAVAPFMVKPGEKFTYLLTQPSSPRRKAVGELASALERYGIYGNQYHSVYEAIDKALSIAAKNDLIFIGGSNFVVADALEKFESK